MLLWFTSNKVPCFAIIFISVHSIIVVSTILRPNSFSIDFEKNTFLKDGKPFRYVSGSIHYFRSPPERWDGLLKKMRLGGLNAITTYVAWNIHQTSPKFEFNFNGNRDLFRFLSLAQQNDLLVILRPSPFIDAEWDMVRKGGPGPAQVQLYAVNDLFQGGLPAWLLWEKPGIQVRSNDLDYNYYVAQWYEELLPRLRPYLYINGGPIIMMQVENEYGSFSCEKEYPTFLRNLFWKHLGQQLVLFTTDGAGDQLNCSKIPGAYATVDFGTETATQINASFAYQRKYEPKGPLVNSEYYPGWLDHWQHPHNKGNNLQVATALDNILATGANVNIYMFHGGTSFGYNAGSNIDDGRYHPCPTSYDYDAPINEAGDPTGKYFSIKQIISKYLAVPRENPVVKEKAAYGKVSLRHFTGILESEFLTLFGGRPLTHTGPLSFEEMKVGAGFMLYQTVIDFKPTDPVLLQTPLLRDRAYVYVNEAFVGILSRSELIYLIPIQIRLGDTLSLLVENQGRVCFGPGIQENKGIGQNVSLGTKELRNWSIFPLGEMDGGKLAKYSRGVKDQSVEIKGRKMHYPSSIRSRGSGQFFVGNFTIPSSFNGSGSGELLDTFVRFDGFQKGLVWVNGINLGRYWPIVGPQVTLYLPSTFLKPHPETNTVILFELQGAPEPCLGSSNESIEQNGDCFITLTDIHEIDGPTPTGESLLKGRS